MTRLSAKTLTKRNLYVLIVYWPRSRKRVAMRRESHRPFAPLSAGDELRIARRTLRVREVASAGRVTEVFTSAIRKRDLSNVVTMPIGDQSIIAEFLRFHVLVRVFGGDPDAWLEHLRERGDSSADVRFARWIRSRLRQDPSLLSEIRRMVDATPFWRAAGA